MNTVPVTITSISSDHNGILFISKSICRAVGIESGRCQIQCGGISQSVRIIYPMNDSPTICAFSPDVLTKLALPEGRKLHLYKNGEKLQIGPVLGILANVRYKNGEVVGQQAPIFEKLLTLAEEERIYAFLFRPQDITTDRINGYVLCEKNGKPKWELRVVPFPDVVYDQIITRKFQNRPDVKAVQQALIKRLGSAYFNPGYFDKGQVHEWLSSKAETKGHLPSTIKHKDQRMTVEFIERYPSIYLKPINGSMGIGIIKLIRMEGGKYFYQIKGKKDISIQGMQKSARKVLQKLDRRLKRNAFIAQEALFLKTYEGRPFDIRVLVQKDQTGQWKRTKMFCRLARQGDITSNLSTGGEAIPVSQILKKIFTPEENKRIHKKIKQLATLIPTVLEEASGLQLGEIGLDIGIDSQGCVWIIEVNSKPWKKAFTEQGSMQLVVQSFRRPLQYGKFLSGIS